MSYADRLQKLVEYQNSIRTALSEKGATISSDSTLKDFPAAVSTITGDYTGPTPVEIMENGWEPYYSLVTNATKIASYAFVRASFSEVNFPYCSIVGENAFYYCRSLTTVNLPECTSIIAGAFSYCGSLNSVSTPKCEYLGSSALANCDTLKSVYFPKLQNAGESAMYNSPKLVSAYLPELTSCLGTFGWCSALSDVYIPKVSLLSGNAFYYCRYLSTLRLDNVTKISCATYNPTFGSCQNLRSLYLPESTVCSLTASQAFSSTPLVGYWYSDICTMPGVYGSIFVPYSLIDSYKTATNWAYYSSRIAGLVNFSATNLSESDTIITAVDGKVFSDEMEVPNTNFTYSVYSKYPKYTGSQDDVGENSTINIALPTDGVTLTVNTTPEDATVKITEDGIVDTYTKTKLLNSGDTVDYEVSANSSRIDTYYKPFNNSITVEQDTAIDVILEERHIDTVTLPEITHYPEKYADIIGDNMFEVYNTTQLRTAESSGQNSKYFTKYFVYNTLPFKSSFKAKIKRDYMKSHENFVGIHFTINKVLDEATYFYDGLQKDLPITDSRIYDLYLKTGNTEYDVEVELEPDTTYYIQFLVACKNTTSLGLGCYGYITDMTLYYDGGPVE